MEAAKLAAAAAEAQVPRALTQEEQAQRLLHLHAKDLIMKLYAQSQYVKTRTRLQRVRGAATVRCRSLLLCACSCVGSGGVTMAGHIATG